jgi:acyl carrier protein
MPDETMQALSRYIAEQVLKQPKRAIDPEMKLISSGVIDSLGLVDLVIFVEDQFGVTIADSELNAQTFDCLKDLATLIETRKSSGNRH